VNGRLEWVAYIGGTRESRQLLGDVVLTREDIAEKKPFPMEPCRRPWDIDLHYPKEQYAKKFPGQSVHLEGDLRQERRTVSTAIRSVSLLLLAQHREPFHGGPLHQRHA
jgi:hypothetical protein